MQIFILAQFYSHNGEHWWSSHPQELRVLCFLTLCSCNLLTYLIYDLYLVPLQIQMRMCALVLFSILLVLFSYVVWFISIQSTSHRLCFTSFCHDFLGFPLFLFPIHLATHTIFSHPLRVIEPSQLFLFLYRIYFKLLSKCHFKLSELLIFDESHLYRILYFYLCLSPNYSSFIEFFLKNAQVVIARFPL